MQINDENKFGFWVTGGVHVLLLILALFVYVGSTSPRRAAFLEVTLGNFSEGKPAQYAKKKEPKVATRPSPSKRQPKKPVKKEVEKTPKEPASEKKASKVVKLPEQKEEVEKPVVKTPKTDKVNPEKSQEKKQKEVNAAPKTEVGSIIQPGAQTGGDVKGLKGDVKADQGTGTSEKKSAPYELKWEGDIQRTPIIRPLPDYTVDVEAVITARFEVMPDGSVGRMIPLKKMNPELEQEVFKTLRSWRFNPLPPGVPQSPQWGTITFRFVLQ